MTSEYNKPCERGKKREGLTCNIFQMENGQADGVFYVPVETMWVARLASPLSRLQLVSVGTSYL